MATGTARKTDVVAPRITKTPGVCGGRAVIEGTRIPVWLLAEARQLGYSEAQLAADYPHIGPADFEAAWSYAESHAAEIEHDIWENDIDRDDFED